MYSNINNKFNTCWTKNLLRKMVDGLGLPEDVS